MQLASSAGKVSMLVSVPSPYPPVIMRPAKGKLNEIQITIVIELSRTVFELKAIVFLIELQIKITSGAIVSLAGGCLAKVEEGEHQGEKTHLDHPQEVNLGGTMKDGEETKSEHLKGRFKEAFPFVSTFGSLLESNSSA